MRKHDQLIYVIARAFNLSDGSVRSQQKLLREHGLWTPAPSVGRGKHRPDPRPSDAANLLILNMDPEGRSTRCNETVEVVRGGRFSHRGLDATQTIRAILGSSYDKLLPSLPLFEGFDYHHTFGDVLDRLLDQWSRNGSLTDHSGRRISRVALEMKRRGPTLEWSITLDDDLVNYFAAPVPPDQPKRFGEWLQSINEMRKGRAVYIRRIDEDVFDAIAKCISVEDQQIAPPLKRRSTRVRRTA